MFESLKEDVLKSEAIIAKLESQIEQLQKHPRLKPPSLGNDVLGATRF